MSSSTSIRDLGQAARPISAVHLTPAPRDRIHPNLLVRNTFRVSKYGRCIHPEVSSPLHSAIPAVGPWELLSLI